MTKHIIKITLPTDENGLIGRECPSCKKYFKIKLGTGLPTQYCHCPYCDYEDDQSSFRTQDQIDYANSLVRKIAYNNYVSPILDDFENSLKRRNKKASGGLLKITFKSNRTKPFLPIKYYNELELETKLICDACGLEFAIYGVFSKCPDCNKLNAFSVFEKSIEVSQKQFNLFSETKNDEDICQVNLKFILSNAIGSFDALGKELRKRYPDKFPGKPRNLFQNLESFCEVLENNFNYNIKNEFSNEFNLLFLMFQIRHIFEHNMGVIDEDFIVKLPQYNHLIGRKYTLKKDEIAQFLDILLKLSKIVKKILLI